MPVRHIRWGMRAVAAGAAAEFGLILARAAMIGSYAAGEDAAGRAAPAIAGAQGAVVILIVAGIMASAWFPALSRPATCAPRRPGSSSSPALSGTRRSCGASRAGRAVPGIRPGGTTGDRPSLRIRPCRQTGRAQEGLVPAPPHARWSKLRKAPVCGPAAGSGAGRSPARSWIRLARVSASRSSCEP